MRAKWTIIFLFFMVNITCLAQRETNLTNFVKNEENASGSISEIDSISKILINKFIIIANDSNTETHKDIRSFFEDYKQSDENTEANIYPAVIRKEHLTMQFIDYSNNYGWVAQRADSVYNTSRLSVLIFIPAFDNFHKGLAINTICFKMTFEIYTESNMETGKEYKKEEKIIELTHVTHKHSHAFDYF